MMNPSDITKAIKHLKPTAEFSFQDEDYSTIKWDFLEGKAPSWSEIQAAHLQVVELEEIAKIEAQSRRRTLLEKLDITEEEARLLLS